MNSNKKENNEPIILSFGRKGTTAYTNDVIDRMVNDYDIENFVKGIDDCCAAIDDIKDDDSACIKRLLDIKSKRKSQREKGSCIIPQKETGTGNYFELNQHIRFQKLCSLIRQLCRNNFYEDNAMHVTLTFDAKKLDFTDLKTAKTEFNKFIKRMNDQYDNFRHVTVYARQENGNWHFHMLCNLMSNTSTDFVKEIWGLGIIDLKFKSNKDEFNVLIAYLCKNLKENFSELVGVKAVLYSKDLQKDLKLMSWKREDFFIINQFIQSEEIKSARVWQTGENNYYINETISKYWNPIVMATPKEKKFKHQKYRPKKKAKKGGDADVTKKSGKDGR